MAKDEGTNDLATGDSSDAETSNGIGAGGPKETALWKQRGILGVVYILIVGLYTYIAQEGATTQPSLNAAGSYYNLLVLGFRAGQLYLKKDVPAILAQMPDPYTPSPLRPNGVMDLSYYKGKLYLYFGPTPALLLFWPYVKLTNHYLSSKDAVVFCCSVGFLVSVVLLCWLWRTYFRDVSLAVVVAGTLALGMVPFIAPLLVRCEVWEVPISCAYMLTMMSLAGIWKALHHSERRTYWLVAASLAFGLAIGARADLAFTAIMLVIPVIQAWREKRRLCAPLVAVSLPVAFVGLGLMMYNWRRFDDPLESGLRYALTLRSQVHELLFSPHHLWRNLRVYFFEPARWTGQFPFVHHIAKPFLSPGDSFGVLTNIPLTGLALLSPLALRGSTGPARSALGWFLIAAATLVATCALTLGLYYITALRYQVDFLPALVLLAVVGILSLERAFAGRVFWQRLTRVVWISSLLVSVAFNLLASFQGRAESENAIGIQRQLSGQFSEAILRYERALRLYPESADAYANLGNAKAQLGQLQEATAYFEQALRLEPNFAKAHNDFGIVLARLGRLPEAISQWEQALQLDPHLPETHNNLGIALKATGQLTEAISHWEQALRINPDLAEPHNNLGIAFRRLGRLPEAIDHWEQALRIKPDMAEAHYNLGVALKEAGRLPEAVAHLQQATKLQPSDPESHYQLGTALAQSGDSTGAIAEFTEAWRLKPDYAEARQALEAACRKN
jgi:tetratricopeptide (TPR) repeat protein